MGNKRKKREKFLAEHKYCCFCGGGTPSKEEDHFPSRALFDNRQWPEGYVFPTCVYCNRITRKEETIVAFISRLYAVSENDIHIKDFEKYAKSLEYNYPGFLQRMFPTTINIRNAVKKYDIKLPKGQAKSEAPLVNLEDPIIDRAIRIFGRKLLLALYYKHAGMILPQEGGVVLRWYTNLQVENGEIPPEMKSILSNIPPLVRCKTSLGDQFAYAYGITDCKGGSAYIINFRKSFSLVGFVYSSASRLSRVDEAEVYRPFKPNE